MVLKVRGFSSFPAEKDQPERGLSDRGGFPVTCLGQVAPASWGLGVSESARSDPEPVVDTSDLNHNAVIATDSFFF